MKKEWVPTQEAFDSLLNWLDQDRDRAGERYETLRLKLIKIFAYRGCRDGEDLADETINRVTAKVEELAKTYEGDPALYFYGVAYKLHLEQIRKLSLKSQLPTPPPPPAAPEPDPDIEALDCLEECMGQLPARTRQVLLRYFQEEKQAKIDDRKQLAQELGIGINALRIRVFRMRMPLQKCVASCLGQALAQ